MSTELDHSAPDVVHPFTGEVLTLATAENTQLVQFLEQVREYESLLREAKSLVNRETLRRMDAAVLSGAEKGWTQQVGDWKITAPSSAVPTEIDGHGLYQHLTQLAREGTIGFEAVERCVETVTSYKPHRAQLLALAKVSPVVAEVIAEHTTETEKPRYVKVSRA